MKRYSEQQIRVYLASGKDETDWAAIDAMTEEEFEKAALEENRLLGINDDWYVGAVSVRSSRPANTN